jgi:hypothetical protein
MSDSSHWNPACQEKWDVSLFIHNINRIVLTPSPLA